MSRLTKNYSDNGGDRTFIGGLLEFGEDGKTKGLIVDSLESTDVNKALSANMGSVFSAALTSKLSKSSIAFQADSTASTIAALVVDFNALLAKLIAAGAMASE